jgi:hypothetical protein
VNGIRQSADGIKGVDASYGTHARSKVDPAGGPLGAKLPFLPRNGSDTKGVACGSSVRPRRTAVGRAVESLRTIGAVPKEGTETHGPAIS